MRLLDCLLEVYDAIWRVSATATIGACIYLSVVVVQTWNASVHRTWQHYARKERERAELMDFIRQAREKGALPPSKAREAPALAYVCLQVTGFE